MAFGIWLIILGIILVLGAAVAFFAISQYNGLVKARNLNEESWRQVDVELNRRYDLIPNLIETVGGYARHERDTLESVVRLRNQAAALAGQGASGERVAVEQQLSGAIRNLLVTVEAYPALQANANFRDLQQQLAATEDRIANARRYYNANVRNYNNRVETFPSNLIANFGNFTRATYFEVEDAAVRRAPRVDFSSLNGPRTAPTAGQPGPAAPGLPGAAPAPALGATPDGGFAWQSPNFAVRSGPSDSDSQGTDQFGRAVPPVTPAAAPARSPLEPPPGYFGAPGSGQSPYGQ
ncbi:MAG: LemA family protein [Propionibacteriaceae bacterium]|jgi:LemA protein|nr:LemA family protein [Propionibacteriaceae bacterium]